MIRVCTSRRISRISAVSSLRSLFVLLLSGAILAGCSPNDSNQAQSQSPSEESARDLSVEARQARLAARLGGLASRFETAATEPFFESSKLRQLIAGRHGLFATQAAIVENFADELVEAKAQDNQVRLDRIQKSLERFERETDANLRAGEDFESHYLATREDALAVDSRLNELSEKLKRLAKSRADLSAEENSLGAAGEKFRNLIDGWEGELRARLRGSDLQSTRSKEMSAERAKSLKLIAANLSARSAALDERSRTWVEVSGLESAVRNRIHWADLIKEKAGESGWRDEFESAVEKLSAQFQPQRAKLESLRKDALDTSSDAEKAKLALRDALAQTLDGLNEIVLPRAQETGVRAPKRD